MLHKPCTYEIACSMKAAQALNVCEMIKSHAEFSGIEMAINTLQDKKVPEGEVLVTFCIPSEGINMIDFFGKFSETLSQESSVMQRERMLQ